MKRGICYVGHILKITLALQLIIMISGLMLLASNESCAQTSPELLQKIQKAISTSNPEIHRDLSEIPLSIFSDGAKMTIGEGGLTWGAAEFISNPSDKLIFQGAPDKTVFISGSGAVVIDGQRVFIYNLDVADDDLKPRE